MIIRACLVDSVLTAKAILANVCYQESQMDMD